MEIVKIVISHIVIGFLCLLGVNQIIDWVFPQPDVCTVCPICNPEVKEAALEEQAEVKSLSYEVRSLGYSVGALGYYVEGE